MAGSDPSHWLHRLSSAEWLAAANNELVRARHALQGKDHRGGVTQARRAAGMAWNAWMIRNGRSEDRYGRSYMDHLKTLCHDESVPDEIRAASTALCEAKMNVDLVQLGPGSTALADSAAAILDFVAACAPAH